VTVPNVQPPATEGQLTRTVVSPSLPRVNLMPPEIAEAAKFRRFQLAMGGAVLAAVAVVGALYFQAQGSKGNAQSGLDAARNQQTALQAKLNSLQSVQQVYAEAAAKEAMLKQAMGQEVRWSSYLTDLALHMPDNVWLTTVQASETAVPVTGTTAAAPAAATPATGTTTLAPAGIGTVTFSGVAFSHNDVAAWLDALAKEKGFTNPYFSNSTETTLGPRTVVNFASSVSLTDAAKSGRYTATGS
jgi:Tfp pilus assembly protein PilN